LISSEGGAVGSQRGVFVVRQLSSAANSSTVVVDGAHMTTKNETFAEFSAILGFPAYFGENWDAFEECLGDFLADAGEMSVPLLVSHAGTLLTDAPDQDFVTLDEVLTSAGEPERARLVVSLADDEPGLSHLRDRLLRTGLPFTAE
jgi:RNAse (barnase) inhibitor barstar